MDERPADDITISIVRDAKPEGLFRYFEEHHIKITNPYVGIYYILDAVLFPTQIIVGRELNQKNHTWIKALSNKVQKGQILGSISAYRDLELSDGEIIERLQEKYDLSWKEAKNYLRVEMS